MKPDSPELLTFVAGLDAETAAGLLLHGHDRQVVKTRWNRMTAAERAEAFLRCEGRRGRTSDDHDPAQDAVAELPEDTGREDGQRDTPQEDDPEVLEVARRLAAESLREAVEALLDGLPDQGKWSGFVGSIGKKAIALAFLLGAPRVCGLTETAIAAKLGETRQASCHRVNRLQELLGADGIRSSMRGEATRQRNREAARRRWATRT